MRFVHLLLSIAPLYSNQTPLIHSGHIDQYCIRKVNGLCVSCVKSILNKEGICIPTHSPIKRCVIYGNENACAVCEPGFESVKGQCVQSEPSSNCVVSYINERCLLCKKGMMEANGFCVPQQKCTLSNCNHCSDIADQEVCLICKKGFSVRVNAQADILCVPEEQAVKNCLITNKDNECETCRVNYFMHNEKCLQSKLYYFDLDVLYS